MIKRRLKINMERLVDAFESHVDEMQYYLDRNSGNNIMVMNETRSRLEDFYDEMPDEEADPDTLAGWLAQSDPQDWQQEEVRTADMVEAGLGKRFIEVPQISSHEGYQDMESFISTVTDPALQKLLYVAIDGAGAFRRFKNVLYDYPTDRDRWFAYKDQRMHERILGWLDSDGLEPITDS